MGNPAPLRVPSDFGSLNTVPEVVRYITAFAKEVSIQFNALVGNKDVYGLVGLSGMVGATGSGNFIPSLISTGSYWVQFREPYFFAPAVVVTPTDVSASVVWALQGVTTTGFRLNITTRAADAAQNTPFFFVAKGAR